MNVLAFSAICGAKCYIAAGGIFVAGFVLGRLTKRCRCSGGKSAKAASNDSRGVKPAARKSVAIPRQEPTHQPIPPGSVEIYVGNLNYDFTEEELRKLFEKHGEVSSARIVINRYNGKSKGFGFVVMPNRSDAENAIAEYSEMEYMGRKMRVNEAKNTITG